MASTEQQTETPNQTPTGTQKFEGIPLMQPSSVKRKRTFSSSAESPRSHVRLKTDLSSECGNQFDAGNESPRTAVSAKLGELRLQNRLAETSQGTWPDCPEIAKPSSPPSPSQEILPHTPKKSPTVKLPKFMSSSPEPQTDSSFATDAHNGVKEKQLGASSSRSSSMGSQAVQPATPMLLPVKSPTASRVISPSSSTYHTSIDLLDSITPSSRNDVKPGLKSVMAESTESTFRLQRLSRGPQSSFATANRVTKSVKRRKSPPPTTTVSELVWSDSEITGHDPNDPNDDGYGINGIGFRPTPAMAEKRRMQRRKQIADWKRREDSDRRARRREARGELNSSPLRTVEKPEEDHAAEGKKVRFAESSARAVTSITLDQVTGITAGNHDRT